MNEGTERLRVLSEINTTETNYTAEIVVSGLLDVNGQEDEALIVRKGGHNKDVAKDISKINMEFSGIDLKEYLYLHTNRYNIYDSLPEGLFHQPHRRQKGRGQQNVLDAIRSGRSVEFYARRFFRPFEMAIDRLLVDVRVYEQRFDKAYAFENLKEIFEKHWHILRYLSVKQSLMFMNVVPLISRSAGNFCLMASVMSVILDCPVKIKEGKKSLLEVSEKERISLSNMKLGVNSVVGKAVKTDFSDLDIIIGPTTARRVRDFQRNRNNRIILDKLIEMVIPFDRNANIKYEVFDSEKRFCLSDGTHKAYLGVNTAI